MKLTLRSDLPFVTASICYAGAVAQIDNVLVDTGSAGTVLRADDLAVLGIVPQPHDRLRAIRGIGGREVVFARTVDWIEVGGRRVEAIDVEVGAMEYGFAIRGILGMDFLTRAGAMLDLSTLTIEFA